MRFFAVLLFSAVIHAQTPLSVKDAMSIVSLSNHTPISLSPDGEWVAYTVQDHRKQPSTNDNRYKYYIPSGAFTQALGCDVWISNTITGYSKNLTNGKGTSWAPVWSPNGKFIAFYSDRNGTAHVWIWQKDTNELREIPNGIVKPFFNFETVRWSPDSRKLLVKVLPEQMTVEQAADLTTGPIENKEKAANANQAATVTVFSFFPDRPTSNPSANTDMGGQAKVTGWNRYLADLAFIDVSTGSIERLTKNTRPLGYWFSPNGKYFAYTDFVGNEPNTQQIIYRLSTVDIANKTEKTLVANIHEDFGISVSWSPDSRSLAYLTSGPKAKGDCYIVPLDGDAPINITQGEHPPFGDDYRAPLWDITGNFVYLISAENYGKPGTDTIWRASIRDHSFSIIAKIPEHVILELLGPSTTGRIWMPEAGHSIVAAVRDETTKQVGFYKVDTSNGSLTKFFEESRYFSQDLLFHEDVSSDGRTIVFVSEDAQHPEDIWSLHRDLGQPRRISNLNPSLRTESFGTSRAIEWRSIDGEVEHGALLLPAGYDQHKRYPLIVNVYGGAYRSEAVNRFGLSGSGVDNLQILASRGYAVLLPDAPLHDGSPMFDLLKTIMPGVDRVINLGIADPQRLGVMGHSYGGYSTLSLIVQTTRFRAAVDSAGTADLISVYGKMQSDGIADDIAWSETGQGRMMGTPWQFRTRYIENSPIFYLDRIQTPLLIVQGALDENVPHQQAEEVFVGLRRLNKEVVYALYSGERHSENSWGLVNSIDYWTRVIDWFDGHLKSGK